MDENEILVSLIKTRRPIYDSSHKDYSNRVLVHELWKEIAKKMNKTATEVKRQWTKLRNSYVREMRLGKLGYGEGGKKKKKSWYLADAMAFLQGSIKHRKLFRSHSVGALQSAEESFDEADDLSNSNGGFPDLVTDISIKEENREEVEFKITPHLDCHEENFSIDDAILSHDETNNIMNIAESTKLTDRRNREICGSTEMESDLLFFKSLLPDVFKLSNSNKRKFKMTVLGMLNDLLDSQEKEH